MADSKPNPPEHSIQLVVMVDNDRTTDHAMQLLVTGKKNKGKEGFDELAVTCKPKLLSCTPVGPCLGFNIPYPGCSPLVAKPKLTE